MHPNIRDVDFSRLRVASGGGAAVLPTTSDKWKALTGKDIVEGYGMSETSPILTLSPMTMGGSRRGRSAFRRSSCSTAHGEPGEICARGPTDEEGLLAEARS
jgi:long-chain acyl-CoA synthetase